MSKIPFQVGQKVTFSKTIGETDIYLFAGITGDFSPNHINEQYMSGTAYKKRIAHGVLSLGISSTASTKIAQMSTMTCVSYGYDHVRFVKPIFINDTITVNYTISEIDESQMKTIATIEIVNQNSDICTVARHILKFFDE